MVQELFLKLLCTKNRLGELDWPKEGKKIPTKNDMIFLHGPMVNPAAGYEVQGRYIWKKIPSL